MMAKAMMTTLMSMLKENIVIVIFSCCSTLPTTWLQ